MRSADHTRDDAIRIASLCGAAARLAYPLTRNLEHDLTAAIAELHGIVRNADPKDVPHLLAHAINAPAHWMHDATRQLLLAAGADERDMDAIAADIGRRSPMPH